MDLWPYVEVLQNEQTILLAAKKLKLTGHNFSEAIVFVVLEGKKRFKFYNMLLSRCFILVLRKWYQTIFGKQPFSKNRW